MRTTFVKVLSELAREDDKVMCVIGDTGFSVFEGFEKEFGDRFVNVGISEQNFVSFGAGLAAMGMKPFIYNVVSFMIYRAYEQIELDVAYQENPVVIVGVGGGHAYGNAGPTHHGYFDIALMRELPNMTVFCPGDPIEMEAVMLAAYKMQKPVYIRIGRSVDPIVHEKAIDFKVGKAIPVYEGENIAIIATGVMLKDAVKAVKALRSEEKFVSLYSMPTIKPIDKDLILECMTKYSYIVTIEEHSISGGLGTAVGEVMLENSEKRHANLVKLGFPDVFAPVVGTREYLNDLYGISPDKIKEKIKNLIENQK